MSNEQNMPTGANENKSKIREYAASEVVITWEASRCQHAKECVNGLPRVFKFGERPWIDPAAASVDEIVEVIDRCPSFALGYRTEDGLNRVAPAD
ncbi:hypothetical protein AUR04nite_01250 [Glutamicibacter uratoxydans]|uniref:Divergent 4Fe-4S mono-cluster domain-containing protein n=1 Tax=Glutamicibacter uratoxydans TaxID=43667 RepID=A0A4Y4DJ66_GLUUR|nr:(4Fe-4S)-binding protein [Glutamicibacter uratoxydans]GED04593.1 hypothetical protein AUR04nite_01250 [Glutamicibacter uratoxydans]